MQASTIDFKVIIFISSKCGGKYTIVRKALKELLCETGMTDVYVFESAPANSQPLPDAFLQYVDESHLCVFLIDNKDGVTDGVLAEFKRAKELGKKSICLFCDEAEKKPTSLEEEIKKTGIEKCFTVHEFSDFPSIAYKSILQDILNVYKMKREIITANDNDGIPSTKSSLLKNNDIINKEIFSGIDKTKNELLKVFLSDSGLEEKNTSEIDRVSAEFLKVVLCEKKFDSLDYDDLCHKIIGLHQPLYQELISLRLEAVKYYHEGKVEKCISTLIDALQKSKTKEIANWVLNDIAIDLRNVTYILNETNNIFSLKNEGQDYLDNNTESVFFPLIDRIENKIHTEVTNQYYKVHTISPYTTTIGGQFKVFQEIAEYFYIALIYGSITHLLSTRSQIIDALSALCFEYSDHDLFVYLTKMMIIERRDKDLEKLVRIYNQTVDIVNANDISSIQDCLECIPIEHKKKESEFLLLKYFGYYFSDTEYIKLSNKLLSFSLQWIEDKNRIISFGNIILETFQQNLDRIESNQIAILIISFLSMGKNRWYDNAFRLSSQLDFKSISPEFQTKLVELSIEIVKDKKAQEFSGHLKNHLLNFRLTTTINIANLDEAVHENMNEFYSAFYQLIVNDREDKELNLRIIRTYLGKIDARNNQQGKFGTLYRYSENPYQTIFNIIKNNNIVLDWDELSTVIDSINNTLKAPNQRYQDKCEAILLIIALKNHFSDYFKEWNDYIISLKEFENEILLGNSFDPFERDSKQVLYMTYQMMLFAFNQYNSSKVIDSIISITNMNDYEILKSLEYIDSILNEFDYSNSNDQVITSLIYLASMMTNHKERDIKFQAVKCLIQLTHSKFNSLVLPQLSSIMDKGTSIIKASIISRVKNIVDDSSSYKKYIIQKGKVDNNYLVRKVANNLTDGFL